MQSSDRPSGFSVWRWRGLAAVVPLLVPLAVPVAAVMATVATSACGGGDGPPSAEALHKKHAPVVEAKLATIDKILSQPFPAPTDAIKLDGPPLVVMYDTGEDTFNGNALYAFEADLRTPDTYQRNPLRYNFNGEYINDCVMMTRKKMLAGGHFDTYSRDPMPWTGDDHIVRMKLPKCAALRYLLVVKLDAFKQTEYIDKETFGGGGALAQVHVFDLEAGGKHAGGVTFAAQSSQTVRGGGIDSDLRENFYLALNEAVTKHLPDARLR